MHTAAESYQQSPAYFCPPHPREAPKPSLHVRLGTLYAAESPSNCPGHSHSRHAQRAPERNLHVRPSKREATESTSNCPGRPPRRVNPSLLDTPGSVPHPRSSYPSTRASAPPTPKRL